jgi:hypothetical protein
MSADLVDISEALEKRRFQQQEARLAKMREAFRAARTGGSSTPSGKSKGKSKPKGRGRPR